MSQPSSPLPMPHLPPLPDDPLVSIVVTCHNYGRFLPDALRSIAAQTTGRWECIVVDDGSTDDTVAVASAAATLDPRIRLRSKERAGAVSCLVDAVPLVRGDIVCLLDADDEMLPDRVEAVAAAFVDNPRASLLVHRLLVTDDERRVVGLMPLARHLPHGDLRALTLRRRSGVVGLGVTSAMAVRADTLRWMHTRGLLPTSVVSNEVDEFLRRCMPLLGEVAAIERPLGLRRLHDRNLSRGDKSTLVVRLDHHLTTYDEHEAVQTALIAEIGLVAPPRAADLDLLAMAFVRARLTGADWRPARRAYFAAPGFAAAPLVRRCFWRVAATLPRRPFEALVRFLYSPGGRKPILNHVRLRRSGVSPLVIEGRDVASTSSVIRRALKGGW